MIINGLEIDTDIVTFLDVYAEVIHEKNILISAKDKFLNNTREELDEIKRVAECRLRAIKELEEEIKKLKEENEKLKKFEAASTEVKKIMDDIRGEVEVLEIVNKLIEILDSFEIEWEDLKRDTLRELKNNPTAENQELWVCIREMAILMEKYVG
nr:MAG TPA_asm: Geminin, DNA replication factor Cdt1-COIL, Cell cycle, DNA replication.8A [Caudoviricetes sp.]